MCLWQHKYELSPVAAHCGLAVRCVSSSDFRFRLLTAVKRVGLLSGVIFGHHIERNEF